MLGFVASTQPTPESTGSVVRPLVAFKADEMILRRDCSVLLQSLQKNNALLPEEKLPTDDRDR
ncbi:MAG: hypothetical protein AB1589_15670 [Cyanobacteriota bacterium]